ncbi:MAG: thioredoxin-disulfide reductase [Syntrophaceae bacterium]|nr:thioredoxin-disulfide reductase [Syntrophaceae bacterium]
MKTGLVILGGGPAGLTAGMYAARARVPALLIEKGATGGQMAATEWIDNYPGNVEPVYGYELAQRMESQARKFGLEITNKDIVSVDKYSQGYALTDDSGMKVECRAVIVCTGALPVKLGIPGEKELVGKGVSYCAVCDGPFFRDIEVAVVGGGDSAVEEAVYLTRFATKVHLIHRRDKLRAVKEIQEKAFANPNVIFHWNSVPTEIVGDTEVKVVKIKSTLDGSVIDLPVGGIFFYVGISPNNVPFKHLVNADPAGFVITDDSMATSAPGMFAAGDIRSKILRQVSTAVGDGAIAAFSAQHYLERNA